MTTTNMVTERIECIEAMNTLMIYVGDEESFNEWLEYFPDGSKRDAFMYVAEDDDLYEKLCNLFFELMRMESKVEVY